MSIRTKNPWRSAGSRIRRMLSTAVARSTSRPSCVSFNEMLRSMPERTMASMMRMYSSAAAWASSKLATLSPR